MVDEWVDGWMSMNGWVGVTVSRMLERRGDEN